MKGTKMESRSSSDQARVTMRTREITTNLHGTVEVENEITKEQSRSEMFSKSEQVFEQVRNDFIQSENTRLLNLLQEWERPTLLHKLYYRKRIHDVLEEHHDLSDMFHVSQLQDILHAEKVSLHISFAEMKVTTHLVDHTETNNRIMQMLSSTLAERTQFLQDHLTDVGSRNFHIAIHELMSRKRKRERTQMLEREDIKYENKKVKTTSGIVVSRMEPMRFPFSPDELKLLETNEIIEGQIRFSFYENFITDLVLSQAQDPKLLIHTLQQALTLKMITRNQHPTLFPWDFPTLAEITKVEEIPFLAIPFVPLDFFGDPENPRTYFAKCNILIDNNLFEGVQLEMALVLQTHEYHEQARQAFNSMIHQPRISQIKSVHDHDDLLRLGDMDTSQELKRLRRSHTQMLAMDQQRCHLTMLRDQINLSLNKLDHRIRDA
jgi:hypothetical protein